MSMATVFCLTGKQKSANVRTGPLVTHVTSTSAPLCSRTPVPPFSPAVLTAPGGLGMSPTTPRRRIARRSTVGTALTAVLALVGSVLLGVATALPAQAHDGHGHVLIFTEDAAGDWHDAAIAQATPKVKAALEAADRKSVV